MRARRNGKLRPKDEAFCQAVAAGMSGTRAYREHIATTQCTTGTAQQAAYILLRRSDIGMRVAELRARDRRTIEEQLGFTRETLARYYVDAITTPIMEVDESHPLCQEQTTTENEHVRPDGATSTTRQVKIKMVGKMDAARELAKMARWMPQGNGNGGGVPQVVINLGALYSPALGQGEDSGRRLRTLESQEARLL